MTESADASDDWALGPARRFGGLVVMSYWLRRLRRAPWPAEP